MVWIDDDGVLRTVALPDPTDVMTDEFRVGIDSLTGVHRDALRELVEGALMRVYETDWSQLPRSGEYVGAAPPAGLLHGEVAAPEDVVRAIDAVESQWRLDAITALDDYID
jgi:hypothetical protein